MTEANRQQLPIALDNGHRAWLVSHEAKRTTISCTTSSPPGSTVRGTIEGVAAPFQLKVRNCRKEGELFVIEGRTQNATRELNAILNERSSPARFSAE